MYILGDRSRQGCGRAGYRTLIHSAKRLTDYMRRKRARQYFRPHRANPRSNSFVSHNLENGGREFRWFTGGYSSQIVMAHELRQLNVGGDDYRHTGGERFDCGNPKILVIGGKNEHRCGRKKALFFRSGNKSPKIYSLGDVETFGAFAQRSNVRFVSCSSDLKYCVRDLPVDIYPGVEKAFDIFYWNKPSKEK